jgi:hypothetical protein
MALETEPGEFFESIYCVPNSQELVIGTSYNFKEASLVGIYRHSIYWRMTMSGNGIYTFHTLLGLITHHSKATIFGTIFREMWRRMRNSEDVLALPGP